MNLDSRNQGRLYWLDWARFIASLAVVFSHVIPATLADWNSLSASERTIGVTAFYAFGSLGQEAVVLFFVLSGYLVGGKLYHRLRAGSFDFPKYVIDRASRIYVPFLPAAALSALVWAWLGNSIDWWQLFLNVLQMQGIACESFAGNGVFWTLSYEVWFYVLGGAVGAAFTMSGTRRLFAILLAFVTLSFFLRLEIVYLGCWLIGAAACAFAHSRPAPWIVTAGVVVIATSLLALSPLGIPGRNTITHQAVFLLMSAGFGAVLVGGTGSPPRGKMAAFEALGATFAASSYTLYLTHAPVLMALGALFPADDLRAGWFSAAVVSALAAICLLSAWLLYLPFERNTAWVRDRLGRWLGPRGA